MKTILFGSLVGIVVGLLSIAIPVSTSADELYRFVGFSTGQTNGAGGYGSRYALCQKDFGPEARMCTSQEFILSPKASAAPSPSGAWLNPVIVSSVPNVDAEQLSVDYSGQYANWMDLSCQQWHTDTGRGLYVTDNGAVRLSYCNVERVVTCCAPCSPVNIALGKPTLQSSNNFGTTGAEAVDGNISGDFSSGEVTCTHPDNPTWWQVDLEKNANIDQVRIYNRTDCCGERLADFFIEVSDDGLNWQIAYHQPDMVGMYKNVSIGGIPARYLRVRLNNPNYLSLAEVQVFELNIPD